MPSIKKGLSSGSDPSLTLRIGAGLAVVAAHAVAGSLLFLATDTQPKLLEQEQAIMVSVIEAPVAEQAQAEPVPEAPQPEVTPPVEPEPEPPPPEPEPEPPPPEPVVEPEPEPEPPPVVEPVIEPAPKPKPKPKPKPVPKPTPKPVVKPVEKPVPTPPPAPRAPVSGAPEGATRNQAPQVAPNPNEPVMLSSVEYRGARPMPVYPRMSQRLREEGVTIVLVDIDTAGNVSRAVVDKSSGFERLDEAALEAARKARFTPASIGGVARNARARLPFNFVLRN